jgi:energy-converting hydrogenase Eha subunit B
VKFITENYGFQGGGLVSAGVRFIGDRLSADLGVFVPIGLDEVILLPVVNFVWTFGE